MIVQKPAPADQQPETFEFTAENLEKAKAVIARYPEGRQQSAVMPLLQTTRESTQCIVHQIAGTVHAMRADTPRGRCTTCRAFVLARREP